MVNTVISRIILGAGAWAAGLLAYIFALAVVWHQSISSGDFIGVIQLSLIAWALSEAAFAAETSGDPAANQLSADLLGLASVLDHLVPFRGGKRRDKSFFDCRMAK
jgi:hypothetical protein